MSLPLITGSMIVIVALLSGISIYAYKHSDFYNESARTEEDAKKGK